MSASLGNHIAAVVPSVAWLPLSLPEAISSPAALARIAPRCHHGGAALLPRYFLFISEIKKYIFPTLWQTHC